MVLIDAVYICQSGGKNLLDLLISQLEKENTSEQILLLIDQRIKNYYTNQRYLNIKINFLRGNELSRYIFYAKNKSTFKKVLCFANVPPPLQLHCPVFTYFHNVILFDKILQSSFSFKSRILFFLKSFIIKKRKGNCDKWIVQTNHVKDLLITTLNIKPIDVFIFPFFNEGETDMREHKFIKDSDFFYPAISAAHKNHDQLLNAWYNLYKKDKITNKLHLTIAENYQDAIYNKIKAYQKMGVPIINHGYLSIRDVNNLYKKCKFVIHPSLGESFGLVLIEALRNNCILLAPDLPYVNSVVLPNYYFDPYKVRSIEDATLSAIKGVDKMHSSILVKSNLGNFMQFILNYPDVQK